jgi:hypothetical protein
MPHGVHLIFLLRQSRTTKKAFWIIFFALDMFSSIVLVLIGARDHTEWLFIEKNCDKKPKKKTRYFFIFFLKTDLPGLYNLRNENKELRNGIYGIIQNNKMRNEF